MKMLPKEISILDKSELVWQADDRPDFLGGNTQPTTRSAHVKKNRLMSIPTCGPKP